MTWMVSHHSLILYWNNQSLIKEQENRLTCWLSWADPDKTRYEQNQLANEKLDTDSARSRRKAHNRFMFFTVSLPRIKVKELIHSTTKEQFWRRLNYPWGFYGISLFLLELFTEFFWKSFIVGCVLMWISIFLQQ